MVQWFAFNALNIFKDLPLAFLSKSERSCTGTAGVAVAPDAPATQIQYLFCYCMDSNISIFFHSMMGIRQSGGIEGIEG